MALYENNPFLAPVKEEYLPFWMRATSYNPGTPKQTLPGVTSFGADAVDTGYNQNKQTETGGRATNATSGVSGFDAPTIGMGLRAIGTLAPGLGGLAMGGVGRYAPTIARALGLKDNLTLNTPEGGSFKVSNLSQNTSPFSALLAAVRGQPGMVVHTPAPEEADSFSLANSAPQGVELGQFLASRGYNESQLQQLGLAGIGGAVGGTKYGSYGETINPEAPNSLNAGLQAGAAPTGAGVSYGGGPSLGSLEAI